MKNDTFTSWVAMNEAVLELEFDEDVPDLPVPPWGAAALDVAERRALELFPSPEVTFDAAHQAAAWRFVRFIGEVFVQAFGGTWVNVPALGNTPSYLGVRLPTGGMDLMPMSLLRAAVKRRTGHEWSFVFDHQHDKQQGAQPG